jgi:hypothetical protein
MHFSRKAEQLEDDGKRNGPTQFPDDVHAPARESLVDPLVRQPLYARAARRNHIRSERRQDEPA